jgi:predicted nucleotidyltransferase
MQSQTMLEQIKQQALPILKKAQVKKAAIFGSYVRGEQDEKSDIDFLIEYPEHTSLFDVAELKQSLEETLGKPIDLVGYNSIKPRLKQYILSEQVQIL